MNMAYNSFQAHIFIRPIFWFSPSIQDKIIARGLSINEAYEKKARGRHAIF